MSDLIYYKDNILSKMKENKELEEMERWIQNYDEQELTFSYGFFSPKLKINKFTLLHLISDRQEYNDKMIDRYLSLSFGSKEEKLKEIGGMMNDLNDKMQIERSCNGECE
jgi:hypothetical protein